MTSTADYGTPRIYTPRSVDTCDNTPTALNFAHARYAHIAAALKGAMRELWKNFTYLGGATPSAQTFPQS